MLPERSLRPRSKTFQTHASAAMPPNLASPCASEALTADESASLPTTHMRGAIGLTANDATGGTRVLPSSVQSSQCISRVRERFATSLFVSNLARHFASRRWALYRLELS